MPVAVVGAARDERHRGGCRGGEGGRGGRVRPVVADLQDVDHRDEAARDEERLDRGFGVAGEEGAEATVAQGRNHRAVVDVTLEQRRRGVGIGRKKDLESRLRVEGHDVAGTRQNDRDAATRRIGQEAIVRGVRVGDSGMDHQPDAVPGQDLDQPEQMVGMRVAEEQHVDGPGVERELPAELAQRPLRVRPAVDEHRRPARRLDQDRVTLADVERGEVKVAVGT